MVAEADESDRSFLKLSPTIAVVTNIDHEHMEAYGSFDRLVGAFRDFADRVPFYGAVIACVDDEPVQDLVPTLMRRVITYGFTPDADVCGVDPVTDGRGGRCQVRFRARHDAPSTSVGTITLAVPGVHNLLNALAAVAVGLELEVPFDRIASALAEFHGAERRYQLRGEVGGVTVVDDYGHHPTELAAVLRAARAGHPTRLVAVFQPHRYTRTRDLMDRFGPALGLADLVILTDIYAAGEPPIAEASLDALATAIRPFVKELHLVRALDDLPAAVAGLARAGDLVLLLGAGSIGHIGGQVLSALGAGKAGA
jgi:UDP-N-acetylmuramate--alanine ligase